MKASVWQAVCREQATQFDEGKADYRFAVYWNAQLGNKDKAFEYPEKRFRRHEMKSFVLTDHVSILCATTLVLLNS